MANEIVLYKPNEQFQLEVQVMDETVWLTQQQMAQLFGVAENNITYHIRGIYKTTIFVVFTRRKNWNQRQLLKKLE